MSALAVILIKRGYSISGSDKQNSNTLQRLSAEGIKVFHKQNQENINAICKNYIHPLVVVSTAVPKNNLELQAAQEANLMICHRSDILAALIKKQPSIAVAGSHGKTTTSTLITTLLSKSNQDPTAVIGGLIPDFKSNGHAGFGKLLIAEADESDGSLVKFQAQLGVITNLELDHTDHYKDLQALIKTMKIFSQNSKRILANYDCPNIRKHFKASAWWSIKTSKDVDFAALPVKVDGKQTIANIYEKGQHLGQITLQLPGLHNLSNTIAAIAACRMAGIPFQLLRKNIYHLKTPGRRFEFRGIWSGRQIVDDYAHHPSEVKATLTMARLMIKSGTSSLPKSPKRLVVVFQPHRYSRISKFMHEFSIALAEADLILLAPVYSAGEVPIKDATSQCLANCISKQYPDLPVLVSKKLEQIPILVENETIEGDLVLTLGAGNINELWEKLQNRKRPNQWQSSILAA